MYNEAKLKHLIKSALSEDIGRGDVTSRAVIPPSIKAKGKLVAKAFGIIAGLDVAKKVFETFDRGIKVSIKVKDGTRAYPGRVLAEISGPAASILTAERTALNFIQRMSGIATLTSQFVGKVKGSDAVILGTRKTAPGLRELDKYSMVMGGAEPHRMGLYDAILIKENHIDIAGGVAKAIVLAKKNAPAHMEIEVEARNLSEVREAIEAGANRILLDNMPLLILYRAVAMVKKHNKKIAIAHAAITTEASGGVNLKNVGRIAKTGVDYISVGALTHSSQALDISLDIIR